MNTIIEKIRAEIERLKEEYYPGRNMTENIVQGAFNRLLSSLSDLEKEEKPIDGFDGELSKFSNDVDAEHPFPICVDEYKDFARHFAQWGAEHFCGTTKMVEPPACEDVDEAAKAYADDINSNECLYTYTDFTDAFKAGAKWQKEQDEKELSEKIASAYQLGLADKEKQMIKEAVEGCVTMYANKTYPTLIGIRERIGDTGDKVKLIIIKED